MFFYELIKISILLLLLWVSNRWSNPFGGLLWFSISWLTFSTKWPGMALRFVLVDHVKFIAVIRLCCYIISSGGALFGFLIYTTIWKSPLNNYQLYALFAFSLGAVINIMSSLNDETITFSSIYEHSKELLQHYFKLSMNEIMLKDSSMIKRLSQNAFVGIYLPQLFKLLITVGLIYFCMGNLQLFKLEENAKIPDIWGSLRLSFSTIPLVGKPELIYKGINWQLSSIIASFLVFLWTAFFASSVRNVFSDEKDIILEEAPNKNIVDIQTDLNEFLETKIAEFNTDDNSTLERQDLKNDGQKKEG